MIRISSNKEEDGLQVVISKTFRKFASGASEASACNAPCPRGGVAAGESRTNTALTQRRSNKKSKKERVADIRYMRLWKSAQKYSCGINVMRKEELCFIKLNIKKERIRKWRDIPGAISRTEAGSLGRTDPFMP